MLLPKVSIVIPCLNMLELTKQTIEGLSRTVDVPWELIVVNNGSTDNTKQWLDELCEPLCRKNELFQKLTLIHNKENKFISGGINIGMLHTCGEYLSIIANDVLVPPKMYSWAIEHLKNNPKIGAISPYTTEDETFKGVENFYNNYDKVPKQDEWAINWHQSICQVFTREMWEKVSEWDQKLINHLMDNDHGLRIYFAGYSPTAWQGIVAYHQYGSYGRAQITNQHLIAKKDSRYYLKKWGIFPDKSPDLIPQCCKDRAAQGQYLSKGQLNFKDKIRKVKLKEAGEKLN